MISSHLMSSWRTGLYGGPLDEALNSAYWASMSIDYLPDAKRGIVRFSHKRQHGAAIRLGRLKSGLSAVDIGAGTGLLSRELLALGCEVTATDASEAMVRHLKSVTPSAFVARAEKIELGRRFDRVFAIGILNFVTDPRKALERLGRHVNPGGILVLQVTELSLSGIAYWQIYRWKGFRPFLFSRKWLEAELQPQGFRHVESVHPLPHDLTVSFQKE